MIHLPDIPAILASHNAEHERQLRLYDINGQHAFPMISGSGCVIAAFMLYFYVGRLDPMEMKNGPQKHAGGWSWAVQLPYSSKVTIHLRASAKRAQ